MIVGRLPTTVVEMRTGKSCSFPPRGKLFTKGVVFDDISRPSVQVPVLQEAVLERESLFFPLPPFLIIKVDVGALFIFIVNDLRFLVSLEPHHVFGVEPPALLLQRLGRQVLSLGPLHVVEDKEQCFC